MKKTSNPMGLPTLAVPKAHMQKINSAFKQTHSPAMKSSSGYIPKALKVPTNLPGMPGKNPGVKKGFL